MADQRVGRRYARALFLTAKQYDVVASVEDDLNTIVHLLDSDESFNDFVTAPYTGREEKIATIDRIFSDRVTAVTMQLLRVMLEKRREEEIRTVRAEFISLRRADEGVVHAIVTTAELLPNDQRTALLKKLETTIGKKVESEFRVDPLLIGGIRVAYGNYVLDGSIRGALSSLRDKLRHDLLKQQ
jgi:F-type H+-transporting ATPase subunit delta